jgi:lipid-binding SYLF domain-containing protein
MHGSNKGVGATASIAFSKGIFGGISLEGAIVGPRSAVNESFYGKAASPNEILYENAVTLPEGTEMAAVYEKLEKLVSATEAEEKKEEQAAE